MITLTTDQMEWVAMGVQTALEQSFGVQPQSWRLVPPKSQAAYRKATRIIVDAINEQLDPENDGETVAEFFAAIDGATA